MIMKGVYEMWVHGGVVVEALRYIPEEVTGSISDGVTGFFH
jgi:hypothetical protein